MCPRARMASTLTTESCHWASIYDSLYILLRAMLWYKLNGCSLSLVLRARWHCLASV
eukprot:COSAG06_NODE_21616_length_751_cov_0.615031_2_plen_56_part_01